MDFVTLFKSFIIVCMSGERAGRWRGAGAGGAAALSDLAICHDDFTLKPPDGVLPPNTFNWLAFVQYIHVTTGLPHHSKAPRVVLVHKQFVLGTAVDLLKLPKNYKLGNVIFGEYEREEAECGMTRTQLKMGARCPRAYLESPLLEITPHPEYSRFGVGNSLALVRLIRPMKSNYMVAVCLPSLADRAKKKKHKYVFMVDYLSSVPRDFNSERKGKKTMRLYTHKECRRHRMKSRLTSEGVTHVLCTSGCGVRPGAPIVSHAASGGFELIGVAAGGAGCARRGARRRRAREPPLYVDVYPYRSWIVNVLSAFVLPLPYPHSFRRDDSGISLGILGSRRNSRDYPRPQWTGWRARTYISGNRCQKLFKMKNALDAGLFYTESFEVNADPPAKLTVYLKISAGIECTITCASLMLPNRLIQPQVEGVGFYNISVHFRTDWFPYTFYYSLALYGRNTTAKNIERYKLEQSDERFWGLSPHVG